MKVLSEMEKNKIEARENLIEKNEKILSEIPWWRIFKRYETEGKIQKYEEEIIQIKNN